MFACIIATLNIRAFQMYWSLARVAFDGIVAGQI